MGDDSSTYVTGGIGSAITVGTLIVLRIIWPMFTAANHKRLRTTCCGKTCVTSLDVEETTPPPTRVEVPAVVTEPPPCLTQTAHAKSFRAPDGDSTPRPTPVPQPRIVEVLRRISAPPQS
jgi:hypothetical protein